ncbi:hypothetical protein Ciccas_011808 [Cichlidogyrus casuarinus]|uniref:Uncharacterized protein n=1 Tax=Cichlidogyrus casuarinus TaxID=1844966 RepID=A0ABD2PRF8_9PLAT
MKVAHKKKRCYGVCRQGCRCLLSDGTMRDNPLCGSIMQSQMGHLTPRLGAGYQALSSMKTTPIPLYVSMSGAEESSYTTHPGSNFSTLGRLPRTQGNNIRPRRLSQEPNSGILMRRSNSDISSMNGADNQFAKTDMLANGFAVNKVQEKYACVPQKNGLMQVQLTSNAAPIVSFSGEDNSRYLESLDRRCFAMSGQRFFPANILSEQSLPPDDNQIIRSITQANADPKGR